MKNFSGRVAVITGAASGIGRAMAFRFAAEGMKTVLADVEVAPLLLVENELRQQGATALAVPTDVSKLESLEALKERVLSAYGAVHVLCNNAGVNAPEGPLWERTIDDWEWVLNVNLWGTVHGLHSFLPLMLAAREEGHIVNTASRDGFIAGPLLGIYRASKHAVVSLTETLYFELAMIGSKVKVSLLCPGLVQTRIRQSERNRPTELRSTQQPGTSVLPQTGDSPGISPDQVADHVINAIRNERFYVFTGDQEKVHIQARSEWIMAERNPTFLESRAMRLRRLQLMRAQ